MQPRMGTLVSRRATQSRNKEQTGTWARQVARAIEEQLREDQQESKMREQKKAKDAKKTRRTVHENDKSK